MPGWLSGASNSWFGGHEFKPHVCCKDYIRTATHTFNNNNNKNLSLKKTKTRHKTPRRRWLFCRTGEDIQTLLHHLLFKSIQQACEPRVYVTMHLSWKWDPVPLYLHPLCLHCRQLVLGRSLLGSLMFDCRMRPPRAWRHHWFPYLDFELQSTSNSSHSQILKRFHDL